MQFGLLIISIFKVLLTLSLIYNKNNENIVVIWLKIAIFFDFSESLHLIFVIRYLKDNQRNLKKGFCSFIKYAENRFFFNRTEIFPLDIIIEANDKLKYCTALNIFNTLYYLFYFLIKKIDFLVKN